LGNFIAQNSKISYSSGGITSIITIIILVAIGSLIYSLLTRIKNWISDNPWWCLIIFVVLFVLLITSVSILTVKYLKYKKDYHSVVYDKKNKISLETKQLQAKIKKYENLYPILKNFEHEQQYNNDVKNNLGIDGENTVKQILSKLAEENNLVLFNNLYLSSIANKVKQIDHLLISNDNLFVIETKNWSIPTYGDVFNKEWFQYHGDKKVFVASPLQQNFSHVETVYAILNKRRVNLDGFNIYNVVVFVKDNLEMEKHNEILSELNGRAALNISELESYIIDKLGDSSEHFHETENLKNIITKIFLEYNKPENIKIHKNQLNY